MRIRALLSFLLLLGLAFSFSGGGSGGGSSGGGGGGTQQKIPTIFTAGSCAGKTIAVGVSLYGLPVKGAAVTVQASINNSLYSSSGTTDEYGLYLFTAPAPATYEATATVPDALSVSKTFRIVACDEARREEEKKEEKGEETTGGMEANLSCGDFPTMRERIKCRINLPEETSEERLRFVPEECRVLSGTDRAKCLENYDFLQRCRHLQNDSSRDSCYNAQVNLTGIGQQRAACSGNTTCLLALRERVFGFVKFRLYNLEEKAERLRDRGLLTEDQTIDFIQMLELKKQDFNNASSVEDKKAVVRQIQAEWETLRAIVLEAIKEKEGSK